MTSIAFSNAGTAFKVNILLSEYIYFIKVFENHLLMYCRVQDKWNNKRAIESSVLELKTVFPFLKSKVKDYAVINFSIFSFQTKYSSNTKISCACLREKINIRFKHQITIMKMLSNSYQLQWDKEWKTSIHIQLEH